VNVTVSIGAGQIAILFILIAIMGVFIFLQLNRIEDMLKKIGHQHPSSNPAVRMRLVLPTITNKQTGEVMADIVLLNDTVETIDFEYEDGEGVVVPGPANDVLTPTSSSPSLGVALGPINPATGNQTLVLTPLVQVSPGLIVTVTDSAGLPQLTRVVDIVADTKPTNLILNDASATTVPQPVPTAPGP
jgi:hypothetical protein